MTVLLAGADEYHVTTLFEGDSRESILGNAKFQCRRANSTIRSPKIS